MSVKKSNKKKKKKKKRMKSKIHRCIQGRRLKSNLIQRNYKKYTKQHSSGNTIK